MATSAGSAMRSLRALMPPASRCKIISSPHRGRSWPLVLLALPIAVAAVLLARTLTIATVLLAPPICAAAAAIAKMVAVHWKRRSRAEKVLPFTNANAHFHNGMSRKDVCRLLSKTAAPSRPAFVACESRDIDVKVTTACGRSTVVNLDALSPGDVLLSRASLALGGPATALRFSSGQELDLTKPLNAQGVRSGESLLALLPSGQALETRPPSKERKCVEVKCFGFEQHVSEVSEQQDSFEISISRSQEPDALREAEESSVRVEFTEKSFAVTLRGRDVDYVLRRNISTLGGMKGNTIAVGFEELCPARCSYSLAPGVRIVLTLRPYPEDWLRPGTRVRVVGLREAQELNGRSGTVTDFFESGGKFLPKRYGVRLDCGAVKKLQRTNIEVPSSGKASDMTPKPNQHAADSAAGTAESSERKPGDGVCQPCPSKLQQTGPACDPPPAAPSSCTSSEPKMTSMLGPERNSADSSTTDKSGTKSSALAWSKQRREAGDEAKRLELLPQSTSREPDAAASIEESKLSTADLNPRGGALAWSRSRREAGDEAKRLDLLA